MIIRFCLTLICIIMGIKLMQCQDASTITGTHMSNERMMVESSMLNALSAFSRRDMIYFIMNDESSRFNEQQIKEFLTTSGDNIAPSLQWALASSYLYRAHVAYRDYLLMAPYLCAPYRDICVREDDPILGYLWFLPQNASEEVTRKEFEEMGIIFGDYYWENIWWFSQGARTELGGEMNWEKPHVIKPTRLNRLN